MSTLPQVGERVSKRRLGNGGVGVIFIRHLTQLHLYDRRAMAE